MWQASVEIGEGAVVVHRKATAEHLGALDDFGPSAQIYRGTSE